MSARLVLPPAALPVPLALAITKAGAVGADMDAEVSLTVKGIAEDVEHQLQRALVEQTRAVTLAAFPVSIKLPLAAPLIAIEFIRFYGTSGELQTLAVQDYMAPKSGGTAHAMPAPGRRWPDTAMRADAVEVQYRCGYGADHTSVPAAIQSYILARVEAEYFPEKAKSAKYLDGLLDGLKVYG